MYESTNTFLQSELTYRADRLASAAAGRRRRRVPRVRRRAASADHSA
ncbi:hypothetical protein [Nocardioides sp.]|nr:hypothetical protein [Nocardioides sp.]HET8960237.1 hypothetical protein [Nocardioides sp.]